MRRRPVDLVVGIALALVGLSEAVLGLTGVREPWHVVATVPLAATAVVVRRSHLRWSVALLLSALLAQAWAGSDLPGGFAEPVMTVLVVFGAGAWPTLRESLALLLATLAGLSAVIALGDQPRPANYLFMATVALAGWVAGRAVRSARDRGELVAETRALEERARIAAELHDVVAHHVSAMVIQASAERRDQPADSRPAQVLGEIERQGRETLVQLRALLGVLHAARDRAPLAPQPGLADLDDLVRDAAAHGLEVELRSEGTPRELGPSQALTVYRVVQEALTNVGKHSTAHEAVVSLRWCPSAVEVEVQDPGPTRRAWLPASGLGLGGMAHRVRAQGGELRAGRRGDGFHVAASVPLEQP